MTTRPTLLSTPDDAALAKWTRDVEGFVEDLIGTATLPSAPEEVKVVSQSNSVKVTFRAVNEVGVSEYKIYRSTDKNFSGENAEHIATVTQAIDPSSTDLIYIDAESTEKSYYFVSAVKGIRRPRLEGIPAGFGSATGGAEIGEDENGGTISGFSGIPGSILFVNEDSLIDQDNENLFYSQTFRAMVVGRAGLLWGSQKSPDVTLIRDDADTLALKRGTNNQTFRVYETVDGTDDRYVEITGLGASGGAEVMANTAAGATDIELIVGTRGDADLRLFRNNIEQVRITDTSTDLGLNSLTFGSAFGVEDVILERVSARVLQMNSDPGADSDNELRIVARDNSPEERYLELAGDGPANIARVAARKVGGGRFNLQLFTTSGSIQVFTDGIQRWNFGAGSGSFDFELAPFITNSYDIGTIALAVRDVFTNRVFLGQDQTSAYDAITIDGTDLTGDGQQDSGAIIMTGLGFESATPHDADWKTFVDVTSDEAASTWTLQTRIDAAGFADVITVTDAGLMSLGGGAGGILGVFSVFNNITNQAQTQIRTAEATVVTSSGSSVTASNLIPAGSFVVGITTRVTTLVTGPAGYDVGDGTDVDRWGNSILVAEDTTSDITDFQTSALTLFPAANDVVITSDGVDFTAGEILITVHYMTLVAPIA